MKSKFSEYFKLSDKDFENLWDEALFILDTNILLNLYRYSDQTKEDFFKIFERIKDRVWIPHQAAYEFFKNRLVAISDQEKAYSDAIEALKSIEKEFKNSRQHPFLTNKLFEKFSTLCQEVYEALEQSVKIHKNRIRNDDILNKLEKLFTNNVGDEFDQQTLDILYKEGEERYKNKIPPGYKDDGKPGKLEKYGDLVIWKQFLAKAKENNQSVIFITDDRKEDWWLIFKGETISPRPELIKEFQQVTDHLFYMYQPDQFLKYAGEHFKEKIDDNTLEEIQELRESDKKLLSIKGWKPTTFDTLMKDKFKISDELTYYKSRGTVGFTKEQLMKEKFNLSEELKKIDFQVSLNERLLGDINNFKINDSSLLDLSKIEMSNDNLEHLKSYKNELLKRIKDVESYENFAW